MSAIQETDLKTKIKIATEAQSSASIITRSIQLLSSVRFGIILLILLAAACMIGMIIMQQSVEGFDKYFAELTPAQRLVYGSLGFFDIYHSWYFNFLLLTLSLNIVLSSIDRFPGAWKYISKKRLSASRQFILSQKQRETVEVKDESRASLAQRIAGASSALGWRATVTEKGNNIYVFAERGAWNRLGAYAVHVALLVIFLGFFMTANWGHTGQMPLAPGDSASEITQLSFHLDQISQVTVPLPFKVTCTDIQQKLIERDGPINAMNTIDWLTRIKITDERGEHEGLVHMNDPLDYRGYRFFQASFVSTGNARSIKLSLTPQTGGQPVEVTIERNGSIMLSDGTKIEYLNFYPDFTLNGNHPDTASDDYNKPAAQLEVTTPSGERKTVYAFAMELPEGAPVGAPFGGYKFKLASFERAAQAHILSVQHDPGRLPFYLGSAFLVLTLCSVFFFSHQRIWARIEQKEHGNFEVVMGGDTNRNKLGFEDKFKRLVEMIGARVDEEKQS